jgi:hypothetical protein
MYGLTRATATLIGAAVAGLLLWIAGDTFDRGGIFEADSTGDYWAVVGLLAAAGLVLALSQLLGGWTKWGLPRISRGVFLGAFLPALIAGLWVLFYADPGSYWLADKVEEWSDDVGLEGLVQDVGLMFAAVAFALGLLFGFTLDTSGPRVPSSEPVVSGPPRRLDEPGVEDTQVTHRQPVPAGPERRTDE